VITADEGLRGNVAPSTKPRRPRFDGGGTDCVKNVIKVYRTGKLVPSGRRDVWYHLTVDSELEHCESEVTTSEDPIFLLTIMIYRTA
jgi:acyl-coenzyme A synthetase/AMP-(fatty) acid ligase